MPVSVKNEDGGIFAYQLLQGSTIALRDVWSISDDTKPSLEFILGFDYAVYSLYIRKKKDLCKLTCRLLWPNFGS